MPGMQMGVRGSDLQMTAAIDGDHSVPAQPKMSAESAEVTVFYDWPERTGNT